METGDHVYHLRCFFIPDFPHGSVTDTNIVYKQLVEIIQQKFGSIDNAEVIVQQMDYEPLWMPFDLTDYSTFSDQFGNSYECGFSDFVITSKSDDGKTQFTRIS